MSERRPALELMLRHSGRGPSAQIPPGQVVNDFLRYLDGQPAWLESVWVAEQRGRLRTAIALVGGPGKMATLLLPKLSQAQAGALMDELAELVRQMATSRDTQRIRLIQAVVDPQEGWANEVLAAAGLWPLADLLYLERRLEEAAEAARLPEGMQWRSYRPELQPALEAVLEQTYQGSLDCPGLNGIREMADVVASHQATGEYDPALWMLVEGPQGVVACLLLARVNYADAIEIVYMGVIPSARGLGLGTALVNQAVWLAGSCGVEKLTLTVDQQNTPARMIYATAGFVPTSKRRAWLWSSGVDPRSSV